MILLSTPPTILSTRRVTEGVAFKMAYDYNGVDQLNLAPSMDELMHQVRIGDKWELLAKQLAIDQKWITAIKTRYEEQDDRIIEMFRLWLSARFLYNGRKYLLIALRLIGEDEIADRYQNWVKDVYIPRLPPPKHKKKNRYW